MNCGFGEDSWESLGLQPIHPKGKESWVFIGRTDAETETLVLWPPDRKNWLTEKNPDAGKDWRRKEKGTTEDEMVGWHHWLNGHESEWTPGVGDGQGGLTCFSPWDHKELDTTERLNWTEQNDLERELFLAPLTEWIWGETQRGKIICMRPHNKPPVWLRLDPRCPTPKPMSFLPCCPALLLDWNPSIHAFILFLMSTWSQSSCLTLLPRSLESRAQNPVLHLTPKPMRFCARHMVSTLWTCLWVSILVWGLTSWVTSPGRVYLQN